jgi:hypothetical protein
MKKAVAAGIAATAAVVLATSGAAQAAGTPGWRFVAVYPQAEGVSAVSASSAANAWAVGQTTAIGLFTGHWNGRKWQSIAPPKHLIIGTNEIVGDAAVAATAGQRAWVFVFEGNEEIGSSAVVAVQWTGTSWSALHVFAGSPTLVTAIATGPADVWGFGTTGPRDETPWAVHYNGKNWSVVAVPVIPHQASGSAAAGDWVMGKVAAQPSRMAVAHWSKGAWRTLVLPRISVPSGEQLLPGVVAAAGPASVWATVALASLTVDGRVTSVLLHWNGKAWSKVPLPNGINAGVASDGHGGFWAASYTVHKPEALRSGLVMYHYSCGRWTRVAVPVKPGLVTNLEAGNMQLIPGTRSVLAGATLLSDSLIEGAVLEYGS